LVKLKKEVLRVKVVKVAGKEKPEELEET